MNTGSSQRQQRLAQALRANLRRRKGQARERIDDQAPADPSAHAPSPPEAATE